MKRGRIRESTRQGGTAYLDTVRNERVRQALDVAEKLKLMEMRHPEPDFEPGIDYYLALDRTIR